MEFLGGSLGWNSWVEVLGGILGWKSWVEFLGGILGWKSWVEFLGFIGEALLDFNNIIAVFLRCLCREYELSVKKI